MLLATAVIWGFAFVMQSRVSDSLGAYTVNFLRSIIAAVFLIPIIILFDLKGERRLFDIKRRRIDITRRELVGGAICGVVLALAAILQQTGIKDTGAGTAGFVTALYVVIVPIIGFFLGRKTSLKNFICALLAIFGVFLISYTPGEKISSGIIFLILCALVFAIHITVIEKVSPGCDGVRISFIQFLVGAIVTLPFMLIFDSPTFDSIVPSLFPVVYLGVMSSGIAYTLQILGQKRTPSTVASIILSLESVFAALGGWLIGNEAMGVRKFIGCSIVFVSVIATQLTFSEMIHKKEESAKG